MLNEHQSSLTLVLPVPKLNTILRYVDFRSTARWYKYIFLFKEQSNSNPKEVVKPNV